MKNAISAGNDKRLKAKDMVSTNIKGRNMTILMKPLVNKGKSNCGVNISTSAEIAEMPKATNIHKNTLAIKVLLGVASVKKLSLISVSLFE